MTSETSIVYTVFIFPLLPLLRCHVFGSEALDALMSPIRINSILHGEFRSFLHSWVRLSGDTNFCTEISRTHPRFRFQSGKRKVGIQNKKFTSCVHFYIVFILESIFSRCIWTASILQNIITYILHFLRDSRVFSFTSKVKTSTFEEKQKEKKKNSKQLIFCWYDT